MRQSRSKAEPLARVGYYHCVSRVVDRRKVFGPEEKERFVRLMRGYEAFCGVRVVTYCVMGNHFHVLVEVPRTPEVMPGDEELVRLVRKAGCCYGAGSLEADLARLREAGHDGAAEALRQRFFSRMWDVSWFMKLLKGRFTQWYNGRHGRKGTLWEDRFRSVLVEGEGDAVAVMAAYIDLNPVRAGLVEDPKEYRWSGYGEALGGGKLARVGLGVAVGIRKGRPVAANRVLAEYRVLLYGQGEQAGVGGPGSERVRPGFSREKVREVLGGGGRLPVSELIRCRVRYFSDGAVLGSREFVDGFFERERWRFGPGRKGGARRLKGLAGEGLFALRDLRVNLFG